MLIEGLGQIKQHILLLNNIKKKRKKKRGSLKNALTSRNIGSEFPAATEKKKDLRFLKIKVNG